MRFEVSVDFAIVDIRHEYLFTLSESIMYNGSRDHLTFRHGQIDADALGFFVFWQGKQGFRRCSSCWNQQSAHWAGRVP